MGSQAKQAFSQGFAQAGGTEASDQAALGSGALVWFRDDLRLDDHLALNAALQCSARVALAFVFDPRIGHRTKGLGIDLPRLGPWRAKFLRASVADLRLACRARGGELLVRVGDPVDIIPDLARALNATSVFAEGHPADEEVRQQEKVRARLAEEDRSLVLTAGRTLLHVSDLPFSIEALPDVFSPFRRKVEKRDLIRPPIDPPRRLPPPPDGAAGDIPSAEQLGTLDPEPSPRALVDFTGGESAAQDRLQFYMFHDQALGSYKETRNGMLLANDSSKFSPWLAHGCISPRRVVHEIRRYEAQYGANESTYWLIFELLWRDYFAFLSLKERGRIFRRSGVGRRDVRWKSDQSLFETWCEGRTGFPFVDACMRELLSTGFMSNRGRQNVASFLAKTLKVDWRWGAAWFESQLVDYDPCSNWGNWQYAAGVGTDPRDRIFNVIKQAHDYDPEAEFVKRWIEEVQGLPGGSAHEPWLHSDNPYIEPIISPSVFGKKKR